MTQRVVLDLNNEVFQEKFFALDPADVIAVLTTFKRIRRMDWQDFYRDHGLRWEAVRSRSPEEGARVCSFRVTRWVRALAYREGNILRLISIHPDHDSAYMK